MNNVLEIKNLDFKYDKNSDYILKNINFNILKNEFVAIIGENGAGKSTLLKLILRKLQPDKGSIFILGDDIKKNNHYKDISYISQNSVLSYKGFPTTVEEVINNHLKFLKINVNVDEYLSIVNLLKHKNKSLSSLSGGELQRVALLVALIKNSKIIILDEPTSNIDKNFSKELFTLLKNLTKKDKTIIMVTHDLHELHHYVDYAIKIKNNSCDKCLKEHLKNLGG